VTQVLLFIVAHDDLILLILFVISHHMGSSNNAVSFNSIKEWYKKFGIFFDIINKKYLPRQMVYFIQMLQ